MKKKPTQLQLARIEYDLKLIAIYTSALKAEAWNVMRAAAKLGISRQRLTKLLNSGRYPELTKPWSEQGWGQGRPRNIVDASNKQSPRRGK